MHLVVSVIFVVKMEWLFPKTICGDPWLLSGFCGWLSDVFEGRRAWATKAIVDMDMCLPRRSSFFLVTGQNGGVGGLGGFHGCVSKIFCPCRVAPKDFGFSPVFLMLHGSEEVSPSGSVGLYPTDCAM